MLTITQLHLHELLESWHCWRSCCACCDVAVRALPCLWLSCDNCIPHLHLAASVHALLHGSTGNVSQRYLGWTWALSCAIRRPPTLRPSPQLCTQLPDVQALDQLQGTLVRRHVGKRCTVTCCAESRCTSMLPINAKQCDGSPSSSSMFCAGLVWGVNQCGHGRAACTWHRVFARQRVPIRLTGCTRCEVIVVFGPHTIRAR